MLSDRKQRVVALVSYLKNRWLAPVLQAVRRRAELRALLALDDRTLADIGVRRTEIQAVLYGVLSWNEMVAQREERRLMAPTIVRFERGQPQAVAPDLGKAA
jgi:uncharacterized protein YjiS (DUF1127 family)